MNQPRLNQRIKAEIDYLYFFHEKVLYFEQVIVPYQSQWLPSFAAPHGITEPKCMEIRNRLPNTRRPDQHLWFKLDWKSNYVNMF